MIQIIPILAFAATAIAQALIVDPTAKHQSVRGFGSMDGWSPYGYPSNLVDALWGTGSQSVGMNIFRCRISENPGDWPATAAQVKYALTLNPNIIVFCSSWAPPSSMTKNVTLTGEVMPSICHTDLVMKESAYSAYVTHLNNFISTMASNGAPVYAVSIQNEPEWTWTCWTPQMMLDFVAGYANQITGAKVIAPESATFAREYVDPILNNATAFANVDILGGHLYNYAGSPPYAINAPGKEVWMTEIYFANNWMGTMDMFEQMHQVFNVGWNAYCYWWADGGSSGGHFITNSGAVAPRGFAFSLWTKNVKPGYTRVGLVSTTTLNATAFSGNGEVVVMVTNKNNAAESMTVNFPLAGLVSASAVSQAQQTVFQITGAALATSGSTSFQIPASSVAALVFKLNVPSPSPVVAKATTTTTSKKTSTTKTTSTTTTTVKKTSSTTSTKTKTTTKITTTASPTKQTTKTTTTTTKKTTTTTTTTTKKTTTTTTTSANKKCQGVWGQCGGIGYTGPTCCTNSVCTQQVPFNPWYAQCLPA